MGEKITSIRLCALLGGAILAVLVPSAVEADTATFQQGTSNVFYPAGYTQTGDNQILAGGFETANVGARNSVQIGTGSPNGHRRVILHFDGLNAMAGATVNSAQIVWKKVSGPDNSYPAQVPVDMYQISDANAAWVEGNGVFAEAATGESSYNFRRPNTWAGSPGLDTPGTDTSLLPLSTVTMGADQAANTSYVFALPPSLASQWINGVNGGVMFKIANEALPNAIELYSSEFGAAADAPVRPALLIDYVPVPEPTMIGFLAVAGGTLLCRRRQI